VTSRRAPLLALVLVVLTSGYLRLSDLGRDELRADELYQYWAAQGLNRGDGPVLPSGERYARGLDVTRLIAITTSRSSSQELAARLPSALFGVLNVVLFALIAWRMAGPWAAVAATLLLGVYPEAVFQSRFTRFYTYQLNFGLIGLYAGWQLVRRSGLATAVTLRQRLGGLAWAGVAAVALLLAARVQVTALTIASGLAVAVALAAAADLRARDRRAWRDSVPLHLTIMGLAGAAALLVADPALVERLVSQAGEVPAWRRRLGPSPRSSYARWLVDAFPLLLPASPLLATFAARRNLRLTSYLLTWFGVPFLIHSLALPFKQERFIFLAVPALLLVIGMGVVAVFEAGYAVAVRFASARGPGGRQLVTRAFALAAVLGGGAVAARTLVAIEREGLQGRGTRWRAAAAVIRAFPGSDTIPVGSTEALRSLLYLHRADFSVRFDELEKASRTASGKRGPTRWHPEGANDRYAGVPVFVTPDAIERRFADRGGVLVVRNTLDVGDMTAEPVRNVLRRQAVELCQGRCGTTRVYYWRFDTPAAIHAQARDAVTAPPPSRPRTAATP